MKNYTITVNGNVYDVTVEEGTGSTAGAAKAASGRFAIVLARGANAECTRAANEVLNGHITIAALYFHVYDSTVDKGGTIIGDHVFY